MTLFYKFLLNGTDLFRELLPNTTKFYKICQTVLLSLSGVNLFKIFINWDKTGENAGPF